MEDSKENSTEIQELDALRIVSFLIRSKSSILIVPCLFAGLTIAANSLQFWMQRTKMRREVNCLFVMMKHLCIADLISGVCFLVSTLLIILEWKAFPSSTIILRIIDFVGRICTECLFGVSTVLLDFLILFKMLITSNVAGTVNSQFEEFVTQSGLVLSLQLLLVKFFSKRTLSAPAQG